jgi:hypothetical protein
MENVNVYIEIDTFIDEISNGLYMYISQKKAAHVKGMMRLTSK